MKKSFSLLIVLFGVFQIAFAQSNALLFDGNDCVKLNRFDLDGVFSYEFSFSPSENLDSRSQRMDMVVGKGLVRNSFRISLNYAGKGEIGAYCDYNGKTFVITSQTQTWKADQWYHVAIVWEFGKFRLFVNGKQENETQTGICKGSAEKGMFVGGNGFENKYFFKGRLREFRAWATALTTDQIAQLQVPLLVTPQKIFNRLDNARLSDELLKSADLVLYYNFETKDQELINAANAKKWIGFLGKDQKTAEDDPKVVPNDWTIPKQENPKTETEKPTNHTGQPVVLEKKEVPKMENKPPIAEKTETKTEQKTKISVEKKYIPFEEKDIYPTKLPIEEIEEMSSGASTFIPQNPDYEHLIDRYEIIYGKLSEQIFTVVKPYSRRGVAALADSIIVADPDLSDTDRFNILYLLNDNSEWADSTQNRNLWQNFRFLRYQPFYKTKSDFVAVRTKHFDLHVNPVLNLYTGKQYMVYDGTGNLRNGETENPFLNTRGIEIRGIISKKIGFYTYIGENQALFPEYVSNKIAEWNAVPNENFWKKINEWADPKRRSVDFLTTRGYITFNILKPISLQFGHDRHSFGYGYRSLFLSDFSGNYLFLKLNTKVWKLNYTNLFAQLTADVLSANTVYPKKYAVFHHLSANLFKNFTLGIFESVVFARKDGNINDTFDLAYLNPIIFYRSVEQNLGSADNSLLGADFRWNFLQRFQLYGQLVIDEFVISEIRSGKGWWANKQAGQLGFKYINAFGIENLDIQTEWNLVRPYTYSHFNNAELSNYAHYRQALAHPLGANFTEYLGIVRYQPFSRLQIVGKLMYSVLGDDAAGQNWGGNILLDNTTRVQDYDNRTGQGIKTNLLFAEAMASWQLFHNCFLDLRLAYRNWDSVDNSRDNKTTFASFGLRLNAPKRLQMF